MTDDVPERPPTATLVDALDVPRNAAIGAAVGLALAVGAYLFRVLELFGPFAGTREYPILGPEGWFLILAFVLASATALLVATVLTLVSAYRLSKAL
ncbi:hypothetical protein ACH9L7_10810 [Haloferax sp. S1W]|uniref:DUF7536 family protein n=1 Tax=Haloferax sp. S1W TaxID=3377110 RepID=UPI0037C72DD5